MTKMRGSGGVGNFLQIKPTYICTGMPLLIIGYKCSCRKFPTKVIPPLSYENVYFGFLNENENHEAIIAH